MANSYAADWDWVDAGHARTDGATMSRFESGFFGRQNNRSATANTAPSVAGIETKDNFTAETRLSIGVDASLRNQEAQIASLAYDWDGYGAPAIDPTLIKAFFSDLRASLRGIDCPPPDVVPGGDGSLQAEWHLARIEVSYNLDRHGYHYTWVRERAAGDEHEFFDADARANFLKWVRLLA